MTTPQKTMQKLWEDSYLSADNDAYLEALYETYLKTPQTLSPEWRDYFNQLAKDTVDVSHTGIKNYFIQLAKDANRHTVIPAANLEHQRQQEKVIDLISA